MTLITILTFNPNLIVHVTWTPRTPKHLAKQIRDTSRNRVKKIHLFQERNRREAGVRRGLKWHSTDSAGGVRSPREVE
jgi:hypothetical protein